MKLLAVLILVVTFAAACGGSDTGDLFGASSTGGGAGAAGAEPSEAGAAGDGSTASGGTVSSGGAAGEAGAPSAGAAGASSAGGTSEGGGSGGAPGSAGAGGRAGAAGAGPVPACEWSVSWRSLDNVADDSRIEPVFVVEGPAGASLAGLELRYWFTPEGAEQLNFSCVLRANEDINNPPFSCDDYVHEFERSGELAALRLTWAAGGLDGQPWRVDIFATDADGGVSMNELNDWSYDPSDPTADHPRWQRVTLYRDGALIWGCEPDGTCAPCDPEAP